MRSVTSPTISIVTPPLYIYRSLAVKILEIQLRSKIPVCVPTHNFPHKILGHAKVFGQVPNLRMAFCHSFV